MLKSSVKKYLAKIRSMLSFTTGVLKVIYELCPLSLHILQLRADTDFNLYANSPPTPWERFVEFSSLLSTSSSNVWGIDVGYGGSCLQEVEILP